MLEKHFSKDYRAYTAKLSKGHDKAKAMSEAIGGSFSAFGQIQTDLLRMHGLKDGMSAVDLACGSGRTGHVLCENFELDYLGVDVVPQLIAHAATITPPSYRYAISEDLTIPADDNSIDYVFAFSLFTHLLHEETFLYMEDIKRVLKPGGKLLFSFLEFATYPHWAVFKATRDAVKDGNRPVLNVFIERNAIELWARELGFSKPEFMTGSDANIPISKTVKMDDGSSVSGNASVGQSVCIVEA